MSSLVQSPDQPSPKQSMSYRKPAPIFIPSPVSLPAPLPVVLPGEAKSVECCRQEEELPPLPQNWREIVHTRVLEAKSSKASLALEIAADVNTTPVRLYAESRASRSQSVFFTPEDEQPSTPKHSTTLRKPPSAYRHTLRGLPTNYRPPTPPSQSHSVHRVQLDIPYSSSLEHEPVSPTRTRVRNIYQPADLPYLKPTPSFHTERTMVSLNSGPISSPWSQSRGTLALTDGAGLYPTPWKKQMADVTWSVSDYPCPDTDNNVGCCSGGFFSKLFSSLCGSNIRQE